MAYQATCTRTYDDGEPCLGEIEDDDGILECAVCMAVSNLLIRDEAGALFLSHYTAPGDTVLSFQTNTPENN